METVFVNSNNAEAQLVPGKALFVRRSARGRNALRFRSVNKSEAGLETALQKLC